MSKTSDMGASGRARPARKATSAGSAAPSPAPEPDAAGDRRRLNGQETRDRIIAAAERLFANKGYEAVGLRDIVKAAGVNSAAIHYHFGSKEALILHVLYARARPIAEGRMKRLQELRARGPLVLEEVLDAFLRPAVYDERRGRRSRSTYADIRLGLSINHKEQVRAVQADVFNASTEEYLQALRECLPHLTEHDLFFRFDLLLGLMLHAMANNGRVTELSFGKADPTDPEEMLQQMIPFIAAGMRSKSLPSCAAENGD